MLTIIRGLERGVKWLRVWQDRYITPYNPWNRGDLDMLALLEPLQSRIQQSFLVYNS